MNSVVVLGWPDVFQLTDFFEVVIIFLVVR